MKNPLIKLIICLTALSCCEHEDQKCPNNDDYIESPFGYPIWHPSDTIIGFNYVPFKKMVTNPECPNLFYYLFSLDSSGFWTVNNRGQNFKRVLPYTLTTPSWSPDGKWITFSYGAQIFIMPFNGEKFDTASLVQLTYEGRNFCPSWSPDGQWIAYDSDAESETGSKFIWKIKVDGSVKKRIAYTPLLGETRMPYWGSDNTILHRRFAGNIEPEIFAMDSSGNNVVQLTHNESRETFPAYSKDCELVFYLSLSAQTKCLEIWKIDNEDSEPVQLTAGGCESFCVSKNGQIVYMKMNDTAVVGNIWVMDFYGNNKKQLMRK